MGRHLRLVAILFVTAVPWMWYFGDYNLYLGTGNDRELKSLATSGERLVGALSLGGVYCVAVSSLVWAVEQVAAGRSSTASRSEKDHHV